MRKLLLPCLPLFFALLLSGCLSNRGRKVKETVSRSLTDEGVKTERQLCKFFLESLIVSFCVNAFTFAYYVSKCEGNYDSYSHTNCEPHYRSRLN